MLTLKNLCILLPLTQVLLASLGFFAGIGINAWEGWFGLLLIGLLLKKCNPKCYWRTVLKLGGLLLLAIGVSSVFIFLNSYDSAVCHQPAVIMLAKGWNPVYCATGEQVAATGWDFSGISLNHILFQPKAVWLYGALLYRMTGIPSAGIGLSVLLACGLWGYTGEFCGQFYRVSPALRRALALVLIAMPQIAQVLTGQIDYVVYCATVSAVFALAVFMKTGKSDDFSGGLAALLWLATAKINGLLFALIIASVMALTYLVLKRKNLRKNLIRMIFPAAVFLGTVLIINWNPYVTSSVNYGGPFYPAHSFLEKHKLANADLTNDFIGNPDSAVMGHAGRFAYAWLSKHLTLQYYRRKTQNSDFYPVFKVAEGCEGYKTIFRCVMLLGILSFACTKKAPADAVILLFLLLAFILPTKYIGYARYCQHIWCVPFLMLISSCSAIHDKRRCLKTGFCGFCLAVLFFYAALVLGRLFLVNVYYLYRSEEAYEHIASVNGNAVVYSAVSQPDPVWPNHDSCKVADFSRMTAQALLGAVLPSEQYEKLRIRGLAAPLAIPLKAEESIFLAQHGAFLKQGTAQEFAAMQMVREPTSLAALKTLPWRAAVKNAPAYLYDITRIRLLRWCEILAGKKIAGL